MEFTCPYLKLGGIIVVDLRNLPLFTSRAASASLEGWLSIIVYIIYVDYIGYSSFHYTVAGVGICNRFAISSSLLFIGVPIVICLLILKSIAVIRSVGRRANGRGIEIYNKGGS